LARKILLADDSVTAQNMGRRILSDAGYEVITVNNGSAALKKIAEEKPDLVILDVYMPGYGGIEVCQRIKDSAETVHIPVLLTVGKLEPFKADEARRANADAHLIKPFEASELLTALTRLEDKIVPRAEPRPAGGASKPERSAKASGPSGAAKDTAPRDTKDTKFGDAVTGWKDRLKIPSSPKLEEPEAEPDSTPVANSAFRNIEHVRESSPEPAVTAVRGGMIGDITAEEIAAIAAAAATCSERADFAGSAPQAGVYAAERISLASADVVGAAGAAASEAQAYEASVAPTESLVAAEAIAASPIESEAAYPNGASTSADEAAAKLPAVEAVAVADAEVAAALESLAPARGNAAAGADYSTGDLYLAAANASEDGSAGNGFGAEHLASRPRWTVQEVSPSEQEAACILEQEMDKAYAALTESGLAGSGAEAAPTEAAVDLEPQSLSSANADYSAAAIESFAQVTQTVQATGAADSWAFAPADDSQVIPHSVLYPSTEWAAAELPAVNDDAVGRRQTWADMAWADSREHSSEAVGVDGQQTAMAASIEDEPILAELRHSANQPYEVPSSADMAGVATKDEDLQAQLSSEGQPQAEAVAAIANDVSPAEVQVSAGEASLETNDVVSGSSVSADRISPAEERVAAVAASYEASAGKSEAPADMSPPPFIESIAAVVDETLAAESKPQAFAAAASMGYGFRAITHAAPNFASPAPVASAINAPDEALRPSPEREAELAAAWAHWREIRESILSPQLASQDSGSGSAEFSEVQPVEPASAQAEIEAKPAPETDPSAIASIVDSMLAELRPKLVEEIAKKLSAEKK
jgi:CheY-like chemotaxis protein